MNILKSYQDADPPSQPEHALPNTTVRRLAADHKHGLARERTTAALIVLAYFFMLRVGEYTPATSNTRRKKRTVALRKGDVVMLKGDRRISNDAPLTELRSATAVSLCLENQKNGQKNQTLFHDASGDPEFCPVDAMASILDQIRGQNPDTALGSYRAHNGKWAKVSASMIRAMLRAAAAGDRLPEAGYDLRRIGSHSLRSGGAMRLKRAGVDDPTIKKLGRWSPNSTSYEKYIQPYIGPIAAGMAARMAPPLRFRNVLAR